MNREMRAHKTISITFALLGFFSAISSFGAQQKTCEDAMGKSEKVGTSTVCTCPALRRQIDLNNQNDVNQCSTAAVSGLVNTALHTGTSACGDATHLCGHTLLNEQITADRKSDLLHLIGSAQSKCDARGAQSSQNFQDPTQLENYYATQAPYDFGAKPNNVSSCFNSASKEDQNQAISKYYYLNDRVKNADLISLNAYASINSILGRPLLDGLSDDKCKDYLMKERSDACDYYKAKGNCKPAGGLDDLTAQTQDEVVVLEKLKQEVKDLNAAKSVAMSGGQNNDFFAIDKSIQDAQDGISRIQNMFPWIGGKAFESNLSFYEKKGVDFANDPNAHNMVRDLITKQFEQDRDDLKARMDRLRQATSCLNNESEKLAGHCNDFNDVINETPDLNLNTGKTAASTTGRNADAFLSTAQCSWSINKDKKDLHDSLKKTSEAIGVIALTTAATAVTGGAAGVALVGEIGSVMVTAGIDTAFAVSGARDAYKGCKQDLYQSGKISAPNVSNTSLTCPMDPSKGAAGIPNVTADVHACIMRGLAATASALPLLRYAHFVNGSAIGAAERGLATDAKAGATATEDAVARTASKDAAAAAKTAPKTVAADGAGATESGAGRTLSRTSKKLIKDPTQLEAYGLSDDDRVAQAVKRLEEEGMPLSSDPAVRDKQIQAIRDHLQPPGTKQTPYYEHTPAELRQKVEGADAVGLNRQQTNFLIDNGYAGVSTQNVAKLEAGLKATNGDVTVQYVTEQEVRVFTTDAKGALQDSTVKVKVLSTKPPVNAKGMTVTKDAAGNVSVRADGTNYPLSPTATDARAGDVFRLDDKPTPISFGDGSELSAADQKAIIQKLEKIPSSGATVKIATSSEIEARAQASAVEPLKELDTKITLETKNVTDRRKLFEEGKQIILNEQRALATRQVLASPTSYKLAGVTSDGKILIEMPVLFNGVQVDTKIIGYELSALKSFQFNGRLMSGTPLGQ